MMTHSEAKTLLMIEQTISTDNSVVLTEAYEQQLFDFKKFFTSKVVMYSTFSSRLKKLQNVEEACKVLGVAVDDGMLTAINPPVFTEAILQTFLAYQQYKSSCYQQLYAAQSPKNVHYIVSNLLSVTHQFYRCWIPTLPVPSPPPLLSQEMDSMEVLAQLKEAENEGIHTFEQLAQAKVERLANLQREASRFYLLHQKEILWIQSSKN